MGVPNRLLPTMARKVVNQMLAGIIGDKFVWNVCMNAFLVCLHCS